MLKIEFLGGVPKVQHNDLHIYYEEYLDWYLKYKLKSQLSMEELRIVDQYGRRRNELRRAISSQQIPELITAIDNAINQVHVDYPVLYHLELQIGDDIEKKYWDEEKKKFTIPEKEVDAEINKATQEYRKFLDVFEDILEQQGKEFPKGVMDKKNSLTKKAYCELASLMISPKGEVFSCGDAGHDAGVTDVTNHSDDFIEKYSNLNKHAATKRIIYKRDLRHGAPGLILRGGGTYDIREFLKQEGFHWDDSLHGWTGFVSFNDIPGFMDKLKEEGKKKGIDLDITEKESGKSHEELMKSKWYISEQIFEHMVIRNPYTGEAWKGAWKTKDPKNNYEQWKQEVTDVTNMLHHQNEIEKLKNDYNLIKIASLNRQAKFMNDKTAFCELCGTSLIAYEIIKTDFHIYSPGILYKCDCGKSQVVTNFLRQPEEFIEVLEGKGRFYFYGHGFCNDKFCGICHEYLIPLKNGAESKWDSTKYFDKYGCKTKEHNIDIMYDGFAENKESDIQFLKDYYADNKNEIEVK